VNSDLEVRSRRRTTRRHHVPVHQIRICRWSSFTVVKAHKQGAVKIMLVTWILEKPC